MGEVLSFADEEECVMDVFAILAGRGLGAGGFVSWTGRGPLSGEGVDGG